jgi:hypothetical protein
MTFSLVLSNSKTPALYLLLLATTLSCLALCAPPLARAQAPTPAATSLARKDSGDFAPGWTLGTRFEGSSSSDGAVYDLSTAAGYNLSRHFSADLGAPIYFIGTPSAVKKNNPDAVSGLGIGAVFADLRVNCPSSFLNYTSAVHLTIPTGDTKKGLSTGHVTWNLSNHLDHAVGDFSPFLNATVGNTLLDTHFFHRPYASFGYNAAFEGGLEFDPGRFSFSASAYDVAPWGDQTMISRVFRCNKNSPCSSAGPTSNRKNYLNASVSTGPADLVRDNGFNASADFKPTSYLDLEFDYARSVPLQLNIYSFGIGVDLGWLLHHPAY